MIPQIIVPNYNSNQNNQTPSPNSNLKPNLNIEQNPTNSRGHINIKININGSPVNQIPTKSGNSPNNQY